MIRIHIGELIRAKLKDDRRSVKWLANKIGCVRDNVYKILKKESIDTELLMRISMAFETDFFLYYSDIYCDNIKKKTKNIH